MRKGSLWMLAGLLFLAAALGLTGYNLWDTHRAEKEAAAVLEQLRPQMETDPVPAEGRIRYAEPEGESTEPKAEDEYEYPDFVLDATREMPVLTVDGEDYIGELSIPALEVELPIFSEWSYPHLKKAPCRYTGTAYMDNMVLCAHNYDRHFGNLKNLAYGEEVTFTDVDGNVFRYEVEEIETLNPFESHEMTHGDWDLTLFTCTIGGRTRVTVRCQRVEDDTP